MIDHCLGKFPGRWGSRNEVHISDSWKKEFEISVWTHDSREDIYISHLTAEEVLRLGLQLVKIATPHVEESVAKSLSELSIEELTVDKQGEY